VKRAIILGKAAARELEERLSYLRDARPGAEERLASELAGLLNSISGAIRLPSGAGLGYMRVRQNSWQVRLWHSPPVSPSAPTSG
jgi:hypothetical protein